MSLVLFRKYSEFYVRETLLWRGTSVLDGGIDTSNRYED